MRPLLVCRGTCILVSPESLRLHDLSPPKGPVPKPITVGIGLHRGVLGGHRHSVCDNHQNVIQLSFPRGGGEEREEAVQGHAQDTGTPRRVQLCPGESPRGPLDPGPEIGGHLPQSSSSHGGRAWRKHLWTRLCHPFPAASQDRPARKSLPRSPSHARRQRGPLGSPLPWAPSPC